MRSRFPRWLSFAALVLFQTVAWTDERQPGELDRLLNSGDTGTRQAGLDEVVRRRDAEGYAALIRLLDHPNRGTREVAAATLLSIRDAKLEPTLRAMLSDPNSAHRVLALKALAVNHGCHALPEIRAALTDSDGNVRLAAAQAVNSIGGDRDMDAIVPLLEDRDARLRLEVRAMLRVRTGQDYGFNPDAWRNRPRLFGLSNAPASRWTLVKLLWLWLVIVAVKLWGDATERIQVGRLRSASREFSKGAQPWTKRYARRPRVEQGLERSPVDWFYEILLFLRPRVGGIIYGLGIAALCYAVRMPMVALQKESLLSYGVAHLYFELLTRVEEDRYFWTLTWVASFLVAVV